MEGLLPDWFAIRKLVKVKKGLHMSPTLDILKIKSLDFPESQCTEVMAFALSFEILFKIVPQTSSDPKHDFVQVH